MKEARRQGRSREHQEEARGSRRQGRAEVGVCRARPGAVDVPGRVGHEACAALRAVALAGHGCPDGRTSACGFPDSRSDKTGEDEYRWREQRQPKKVSFSGRRRIRKFFGHITEAAEMPNLIEVQKSSYDQFLMVEEPEGGRGDEGLQAVFKSVFPITDFAGTAMLEFVRYEFEPPKYDVEECRQRDMTYRRAAEGDAAPDRVRRRPGHRREVRQGHQGAGRLHGRHAAHDGQRHLHHQRHRARHRLADAPLAGRVLRPRQGQDAFLRQAAVRRPHHPLSRLLARHRVRRQGHRARAHRPAPQDPGHVAPDGARHGRRGDPLDLLHLRHRDPRRRRLAAALRRRRS